MFNRRKIEYLEQEIEALKRILGYRSEDLWQAIRRNSQIRDLILDYLGVYVYYPGNKPEIKKGRKTK